ncbi:hypothetical protein D9613_001210 [Agrocybe pediades]|uniref:pyranose dehydrogenase (acceptor) n=1 Tax=Agrocybe pediades TaxID=84607 RepID=A0A8H4R066_9AGAR|nr:hypothetical protein D9613_001210 [Agrocybe pediades]
MKMKFGLLSLLPSILLRVPFTLAQAEYDYIVIGGGTAGLAVANRLTENPNVTVVVLEFGQNVEDFPEVFIPGMIGAGRAFTELNWAYQTVPQPALQSRQPVINAGKALGGGTIINSMIFPRAERAQYDSWGAINNNDPNWTWDNLLPYFKKLEDFTPPNEFQTKVGGARFQPQFHGTNTNTSLPGGGRVKIGFPNFFFPQSTLWRTASGLKPSPDLDNGLPQGTVGVSANSLDAKNNTRCSSVCGYYTSFADRKNFVVLTGVLVTRILWSNSTISPLQAVGVEYRTASGDVKSFSVRKEVILSAGAIGSPKVLELSGVGNATILRAAGVEPVFELPTVGENFADHVHSWANGFTNISITKDSLLLDPAFNQSQVDQWFHNRTGLYAAAPRSLSLVNPSNLFSNKQQLSDALNGARRNLSHFAELFSNGNKNLAKGIEWQHNFTLTTWAQDSSAPVEINYEPGYSGPTPAGTRPARKYTAINAVLLGPLSRGRTHIASSDPSQPPAVNPAYYSHPLDVLTHVKGIQLGRKMLRTPPLGNIFEAEFEPGADKKTDADVEQWARQVVQSDNHVIGSLAMMPQDLGGVVDTRLRVYGIRNVRVVDASIIPFPISAHLESSVYMIAERASLSSC